MITRNGLLALLGLDAGSTGGLGGEGSLAGAVEVLHRVVHQDGGDDDPEDVEEGKVKVVVVRVGVAVWGALDDCGQVVEDAAVDLAQRQDQLRDVARGCVVVHGLGGEKGQGTPGELRFFFWGQRIRMLVTKISVQKKWCQSTGKTT